MPQPPSPAELQLARLEAAFSNMAFVARKVSDVLDEFKFVSTLALDNDAARETLKTASDAVNKASGKTSP